MIQTMDVHEDQDLDGLPNVPSSRYRNSDAHDANNEDGNPANWIGKDFDDQDYGEDSEEDYIEETPALNVIPSDESNQEEEPQEQQPSKKRKFATTQKQRQPKKPTQTKKPPPPQKRTQEKYPTKPKPKNKKKTQKELRDRINPTRRGEGRDNCTAPVWKYFEIEWIKEDDGIERKWAECNYCLHLLAADPNRNGTTSINKHFNGCKLNPDNIPKQVDDKQQKLSFTKAPNGEGHVYTWKHDDTRIQLALLGLFTIGELPFKFIENEAFIEFVNALNGRVKLPSRHKISRDVVSFYLMERQKLYKHLSNPKTAIHLTTDTWISSCQKINYMVVTAHFITEDFVMHKRVVNFREVDTHKAEDMARELLICINEWGMKNVMTMTVDNAKTNDAAINIIVKELPGIYENGKHFHIRCMAHIINLVVKMGLKHEVYHVKNLQDAVKYIRASPQRIKTFKQAMKDAVVESQRFLCGETPTRWNSTFELLRSAYDVKDAFLEYSHQDPNRNGTTSINKHFNGCKLNPDNIPKQVDDKQQKLSFTKAPNGEGHVYTWKHDDTRIQLALLGLFTIGELPFKFIENEAFIEFVNALNGRVKLPSRHKISRDVVSFYLMERQKLYKHLSNPKTAIHLTTDTWTSSCQKINYMVVTAHFITEDFVMHKRVVNFREVDTHKAEDMARELLICINEWGMKNVMTMTVDNAKTNDAAINIIVKELPGIYENGKHFHIRCMAHIINLVVKMGLKHEVYHVKNLQDAVKYIRASPQRIKTFKQAMKDAV
ncbi:unnamed protein product [Lactuca saligna]|uniref:BED-type domain-containing protein n=1 Tax=Lactuca saligna TaxID=75948 RepID=A0AA35Z4E4_LACSI|nr:unnamed protein product [Lactuca saligna]